MLILSPDQLDQAADLLKQGKLVAFPTETVYGLGAPIFNPQAIAQIYRAKGRPSDNPLIAHIAALEEVEQIACDIPASFYQLAEKFFPGPLTVVLKKHPRVPSIVSGGLETIAVRMPRHELALKLIAKVGEPLVAPSANLSGRPSSTSARHVVADFDGKIEAVIDGEETEFGIESTVISLLSDTPCLLRPGALPKEEIEKVLGVLLRDGALEEKHTSPGTRYRHYAPHAKVRLFTSKNEFDRYVQGSHCLAVEALSAANLYAELRKADEQGYEEIAILCTEEMAQDAALMDRLQKASQSTR